MTDREIMQQALEALESCDPGDYTTGHVIYPSYHEDAVEAAITALETALAEPVQEPVAWMTVRLGAPIQTTAREDVANEWAKWGEQPLYTAPPQRKPLTEEQCVSIFREAFLASPDPLVKDNMTIAFARAIERAHGIVS